MFHLKSKIIAAAFSLAFLPVFAAIETTKVGVEPVCGVWSQDVDKVKARAQRDGIPVFMVASSTGCEFCTAFAKDVMDSSKFKAWQAAHGEDSTQPYLFLYVKASMGNWTSGQPSKIGGWVGLGSLPRVSCYWYKDGREVLNAKSNCFPGRGKEWNYYTASWFDPKFKSYSKVKLDAWDPADDVESGATKLDTLDELAAWHRHGPHSLSASDAADWFALKLDADTRYQIGIEDYAGEGTAPTVVLKDPSNQNVLSAKADVFGKKAFTATANGNYKLCVSAGSENSVTYTLAYRQYPEIKLDFESAAYTVKEDAGKVELKVKREGRPLDEAKFKIETKDGTAKAGTDYVAFSKEFTMASSQDVTTFSIDIKDIGGAQAGRTFEVKLTNLAEDAKPTKTVQVTIEDVDVLADKFDKIYSAGATGDETPETATAYDTIDTDYQRTRDIDGTDRVLSSQDRNDWYTFPNSPLKAGASYQFRAGYYGKRPATESGNPVIRFYYGLENAKAGKVAASTTLDYIDVANGDHGYWRMENLPAEADGKQLYVQVTNTTPSTAIFNYNLEWKEWKLPQLSLVDDASVPVVSPLGVDRKITVPVKIARWRNFDEAIAFKVAITSNDPRVHSVTNEVKVAAASDDDTIDGKYLTETSFTVSGDNGFWAPDAKIKIVILEDVAVHEKDETTVHELELTLKSSMPERDANYGEPQNDTKEGAKGGLELTTRPTTIEGCTLNGSDEDDWYVFDVDGGKEYAFQVKNIETGDYDGVIPVEVEVLYPNGSGGEQRAKVSIAEFAQTLQRFEIPVDGKLYVHFHRTAAEPKSIVYNLMMREFVPTEVYFKDKAISVSEMATSVRIPIYAEMEVPLPFDVKVVTSDGTAKAGEDYVAKNELIYWNESELSEDVRSYVKYVTIELKKNGDIYEGKETFDVELDTSDSLAQIGNNGYGKVTVTIIDTDTGTGDVGTFRIDGCVRGEDEYKAGASAVSVTAGEKVKVRVSRSTNYGKVTATLKMADSGKTYNVVFNDLETSKTVDVVITDSPGVYKAPYLTDLTLTTDNKSAKVANGKLQFRVVDNDKQLVAKETGLTDIPLSTTGNGWFYNANGALVSKTLAKNAKAVLKTTLKGPGELTFRCTQPTAISVLGAASVNVKDGVFTVKIASGSKKITITYTAATANAAAEISDMVYTPSAGFFRQGSFNGVATLLGSGDYLTGNATFAVSAKGKLSGKFIFNDNRTYTFSGTVNTESGESNKFVARRNSSDQLKDIALKIDEQGKWTMTSAKIEASGERNGWNDRPLVGAFAENAELLKSYWTSNFIIEDDMHDEFGGYAVYSISASGAVTITGSVGGKSVSASSALFFADTYEGVKPEFVALLPKTTGVVLTVAEGALQLVDPGVTYFTGARYQKSVGFDQLCAVDGDAISVATTCNFVSKNDGAVWKELYFRRKTGKAECDDPESRLMSVKLNANTGIFTGWVVDPLEDGGSAHRTVAGAVVPNYYFVEEGAPFEIRGGGWWYNKSKSVYSPLVLMPESDIDGTDETDE